MLDDNYYQEVESYFIERRGSPLFISPAEWHLVSKWDEAGIPLHVVKDGIDRVFDRPTARQKTRRLSYCRQSVEAAFRRFQETAHGSDRTEDASDGETTQTDSLVEHLRALVHRLGSSDEPVAREVGERLQSVIDVTSPHAVREEELAELDQSLMAGSEASLDASNRAELRTAAENSLAEYRERMPDEVYASAVESAFRRRLRKMKNLPRISLYDR